MCLYFSFSVGTCSLVCFILLFYLLSTWLVMPSSGGSSDNIRRELPFLKTLCQFRNSSEPILVRFLCGGDSHSVFQLRNHWAQTRHWILFLLVSWLLLLQLHPRSKRSDSSSTQHLAASPTSTFRPTHKFPICCSQNQPWMFPYIHALNQSKALCYFLNSLTLFLSV